MEVVEYKEIKGSAFADAYIYAKIKLDDGVIVTVKASRSDNGWEYVAFPFERELEAIWAFKMLFMCINK